MAVSDPRCGEGFRERGLIELWIAPRAWKATDVDQGFDAGPLKALDELFGRTGAVADGKDPHGKQNGRTGKAATPFNGAQRHPLRRL